MYQLALEMMQEAPEGVVCVDDRAQLVKEARSLGLQSIKHRGCEHTRSVPERRGLSLE